MARKKSEVVTGTVEMVVNPILESEGGYNTQEGLEAIKNPEMRKAVEAFVKADTKLYTGMWDKAKAAARMKVDVRKEFGSDDTLAHFLGLSSRSAFNRLRRAGELAKEAMEYGLSVTVVSDLLPLENDRHGNQNVVDHFAHVSECMMTAKEVREYIKQFVVGIEDKSKKNDSEQAESTESSESVGTSECCVDATAEEEVSWTPILSINTDVLNSMESSVVKDLMEALCAVATDFEIDMNDIWLRR